MASFGHATQSKKKGKHQYKSTKSGQNLASSMRLQSKPSTAKQEETRKKQSHTPRVEQEEHQLNTVPEPAAAKAGSAMTPNNSAVSLPPFPSFNKLPNEIQRRIFEVEFSQEPRRGTRLALVSHKVKEWIEPLIYQNIILPGSFHDDDAEERFQLFSRTFKTGTKPKAFYMQHVKSIFSSAAWWENTSSCDFEVEFLSACHASIENLECWSEPWDGLNTVVRTMHFPKLKILCINIDLFPQDKNLFSYPIFQNITHLDIGSCDAHEMTHWNSLVSLRCLTHMRIQATSDGPYNKAMDEVIKVASQARRSFPPNLRYFVILVNADLLWEAIIVKDSRRWGRFNAIRLGKFDRRILLGCFEGSSDFRDEVEEEDQEEINRIEELVAVLPYPTEPRLEPRSTWEEVAKIASKREAL